MSSAAGSHPFLHPSELPYQLPDFANITAAQCQAGLAEGMALHRGAVEDIVANADQPTFDNTIAALDDAALVLERAANVAMNFTSALATPDIRDVEQWWANTYPAHEAAIYQHRELAAKVKAVYDARSELPVAERRLTESAYRKFQRAGAFLDESAQLRLRTINSELAQAETAFGNRVSDAMQADRVLVADESELAGLGADDIASAAAAAQEAGLQGWLLPMVNYTNQPILAQLAHRETRRRVLEASMNRCQTGEFDVTAVTLTIVALRAERAELLGYANHAEYALSEQTAPSTEAVEALLHRVCDSARANADREAAALRELALADGVADFAAHDWRYYSRQASSTSGIDTDALTVYFEYDRVLRDGVFAAAEALYGITFVRREDLVGYHEDCSVFEAFNASGEGFALLLLDPYARDTKRGGAWMTNYVNQSHSRGTRPVVSLVLNCTKPQPGKPSLMTVDEVETLFHEFGHGLHGLLSDVEYAGQSGANVPQDFVEFPSQVNEMWAWEATLLSRYARHHETGEPLPQAALEHLTGSGDGFGAGFKTTEIMAATVLDWEWHKLDHQAARAITDIAQFERHALARWNLDHPQVPPRYRTTYFAHSIGGWYSAGYYSYMWSEVLDAQAAAWFRDNGGLRRELGEKFRDLVLSRGGSVDSIAAFTELVGAEPDPGAYLKRHHLVPSAG